MVRFAIEAAAGALAQGQFLGKLLEEWGSDTQEFLRNKLPHLVVIALIALILNRILRAITTHMVRVAESHAAGHSRISQVRTLAGVIRTTGIAIIAAIVGLQFLAAVGIDLAPLLASAGVAGVAIGLAAQNIVRDMLNGILILIEDQFSVGDTVRVAGVTGMVEAMTLRKTTLREADGTLTVIPNSQISIVANQSIDYSVGTVTVSMDYSTDPNAAIEMLKKIAMEVRNSEEFREVFLTDPQILGVDAVKGSEILIPVLFKTRATKQYAPMREFRRRVRIALEEGRLLPGDPLRVFNFNSGRAQPEPARSTQGAASAVAAADPTAEPAPESNPFQAG
ncbi:MAG TPA: mechanosensitive ion channel family protein [Terracidiphilus sp.]|nr:mechanosensitive ion channel family protein [Terracidiphilus sp.]